ncbi:MAG TPA: hypothetical protein VE011_08715 [Candidatus Dormibacteraeota bacterium]|nr:hypothetical protein [Candidatus Dormibacteraeota bacterium]
MTSRSRPSLRAGAVLSVLLAALLAACGSEPVPTPAPITTSPPEPTPTVTVYDLGATVWYEGLVIHVDTATATLDERGGPVEVVLRLENPNPDANQLDAPIQLVMGGTRIDPNHDSTVPLVPPNGSMPANLTFDLQAVKSVDTAVIEIGKAPNHIARVPLTASAGAVAVFEPQSLALKGSATSVDLKLSLTAGGLRWDLPDYSQELDAGVAALTLTYDATYAGTFQGGFAFTGDNVALRLPDGTVVLPRSDGHSQSIELIGPGKTKKGLFSRFEIPSGASGKFALLVKNGSTTRAITFTIGG